MATHDFKIVKQYVDVCSVFITVLNLFFICFLQAKRRLELGDGSQQYLSEGLKTPKGKGRASVLCPDSPKSKLFLNLLLIVRICFI